MMRFRYLMIILCLFAELPAKVIQADTPAHLYTVRLGLGNEDLERQINALPWIKVTECDYPVKDASRIDFSRRDLRCATIHFELKGLYGARFDGSRLDGSTLLETKLTKCSFRGASLRFCEMDGFSNMPGGLNDFTNADVEGSYLFNLPGESLRQTKNYREKKLAGIQLLGGLENVSFRDFSFDGILLPFQSGRLSECEFANASLNRMAIRASLSREQFYATANYRRKDLSTLLFSAMRLAGWDFSGCDLAYFERCDLRDATLVNAWFVCTRASQVHVYPADAPLSIWQLFTSTGIADIGFDECSVTERQLRETANWKRKNLRGMHLKNMDLEGWDFSGMDMEDADLSGSLLKGVRFTDAHIKRFKLNASTGLTLRQIQETKTFRQATEADVLHEYPHADLTGLTDEQRALQQSLRKKWPRR